MSSETAALIERRTALLGSAYRLFYDEPVHIVRGEGVWLYDTEGRAYLDMYNNVYRTWDTATHMLSQR